MSLTRRVNNEIKRWPVDWIHVKMDHKISIILPNFMPHKLFFFEIILGDRYPFRCPKVLCNNNELIIFYRDTHCNPIKDLQNDMKLLTGKECGCCQSLLCENNWGPSITIKNIIDEFCEIWISWKRVIERLHCKKIIQKYLIEDIPIHEYL